jgi:putative ABC transport system permease protein
MLASLIAGMLAGLVTGFLHTVFGIPAILAGILTQLMLWSVNLLIMGGSGNIAISRFKYADKVIISSGSGDVYKTIVILLVFTAVVVAALYWFFGTKYGMTLRATGNNLEMSRAQGINTSVTKVFGLALSNGIVALSGALLAQQQGMADINMGKGAIVIGLAAIIIGLSISLKIKPNFVVSMIGVVGGGVIYYIIYNVVILMGLKTDFLKMFSAIIVIAFLAVPYIKSRYFTKIKPLPLAEEQEGTGGEGHA